MHTVSLAAILMQWKCFEISAKKKKKRPPWHVDVTVRANDMLYDIFVMEHTRKGGGVCLVIVSHRIVIIVVISYVAVRGINKTAAPAYNDHQGFNLLQ